MTTLIIFVVSIFAGCLGALLGLGGGMIITPLLTLLFGVDIRYAIAASLVSVIATSSGAASRFLIDRVTNLRLGIFLEVATCSGAILGALISTQIDRKLLFFFFSALLLYSAFVTFQRRSKESKSLVQNNHSADSESLAEKLKLNSSYPDQHLKQEVAYRLENIPFGFSIMFFAGVMSALLGIGSGVIKVLALDSIMKAPIKVSTATSTFMMGVTAAASAVIFFVKGDIQPEIAAPVALGVLIGAPMGVQLMNKLNALWIRYLFIVVLLAASFQLALKGLQSQ